MSTPTIISSTPVVRPFRVILPKDITEPFKNRFAQSWVQLATHDQMEIEARTQQCSAILFYECLNRLRTDYPHVTEVSETVEYYTHNVRARRRTDSDEEKQWSKKAVLWKADSDLYPHSWRFSLSNESDLSDQELQSIHTDPSNHPPTLTRTRIHWHYDFVEGHSMDLYRWTGLTPNTVEFQIEVDLTVHRTGTEHVPNLSTLWWPLFKSCLSRYVHPNHFMLCSLPALKQYIEPWVLNSVRLCVFSSFPQFPNNTRPMTDPAFHSKLTRDYRVSLKLDGQNEVFLVGFQNGVIVVIVNHVLPIEMRYLYAPLDTGALSNQSVSFMLQGEWMQQTSTIHVFDALVLDTTSVMCHPHGLRLEKMNRPQTWRSIVNEIHHKSNGSLNLISKPWALTIHQLNQCIEPGQSNQADGYIWMDVRKPYLKSVIFKDKPVKDLTVDVQIRVDTGDPSVLWCYSGSEECVDKWSAHQLDTYWMDLIRYTSRPVIECQFHYPGGDDPGTLLYPFTLRPVRFRPGKARGNSWYVIQQTKRTLLDSSVIPGVIVKTTTKIEHSRSAHNTVKQQLITQWVVGENVLDIGFGKGGDMLKYAYNTVVKHIYACEPNEHNWLDALERYRSGGGGSGNGSDKGKSSSNAPRMLFNLIPVQIGRGCQDLELTLLEGMSVQTVCMFFSLAYLFEKGEYVQHWLNVLDTVKSTRLILTFMDQYELAQLIMTQRSIHVTIQRADNGYQKVDFDWPVVREILDTGSENDAYNHVVKVCMSPSQTATEVREWLVHQPTLIALLQSRGWRIQHNQLFSEQLMDSTGDPWHRLFRAQVWERK